MQSNNLAVSNNSALLEKVITTSDLSGLTSFEKVSYIKNICESIGLNPFTKPIQLLKFQGKEIAYFTKDATEQLRKNNNISISKVENKIIDGGIYIVTVYAETSDGRKDASTGAIAIAGLKGDALCNAMLKAETKAKRRVTLSICGLGFVDESEVDSMKGSIKVDVHNDNNLIELNKIDLDEMLMDISQVSTLGELQEIYTKHYRTCAANRDPESLKKIIEAKDKRKGEIEVRDFNKEINESIIGRDEIKNMSDVIQPEEIN